MASMIAPGESSSMKSQWKYDVFLSFRGEDTRKNFTDHLYTALHQKGIVTYRDDPNLEKGENISNELLQAIENSRYLIVIMSRDYASSTWCLEELVKIVECMKGGEQMAIPIFYKVDPSDVRKQKGTFKSAFVLHEATFKDDMDKVQRWKNALIEIAGLAGWHSLDRNESQFIQDIVKDLQNKLGKKLFYAPKNLVGMESRFKDMFQLLSLESNDVRFIGISGMGGIGKSTLARAVFDDISAQFEGCSFLANIRKESDTFGLVHLQNKLLFNVLQEKDLITDVIAGAGVIAERLKHKRVLVVLDDVDKTDHIENLARKSWFGCGSRIIVTTRDEHLLKIHDVDAVYKAKELSNKDALELFRLKALGKNNSTKEFVDFSKEVTRHAKGLPLAVTVLGSFLFGRSMSEWQSTLTRLQETPNKEILETLRLSFDGLEEKEKAIFLDIACFFIGKDKDYVMEILECCDLHPKIGVNVLIERSLLTVINNEFKVHDLLQEMAWEIVKHEAPEEPGRRSRLWLLKDLNHIMASGTATERIEGIIFHPPGMVKINADCFLKMTNLRFLIIPYAYKDKSSKIKYLSNELRLLTLPGFPSSYLPTNFLPESLYELHLHRSHLRRLWRGQKVFEKLKQLDLEDSKYLTETPDFNMTPNLEKLILYGCKKLSKIHPSIGVLRNLVFLDLMYCTKLRQLPPSIGNLKSLKALLLYSCLNLKELPDSICSLEYLEELDLSYTAVAYQPLNLRNLKNLRTLSYYGCDKVQLNRWSLLLPKIRRSMVSLNDLGRWTSLRGLYLSHNYFCTIPESINQIPGLERLSLNFCENLQALPMLPESIIYVEVTRCTNLRNISNLFIICTGHGCRSDICFLNCSKLLPEELETPLALKYSLALVCYIIGFSVFSHQFGPTYVVAPKCKIPGWFSYQKDGSLLTFRIRDPRFKNKVCGFALCVSFLRQEQECSDQRNHEKGSYVLICEFSARGNQLGPSFRFRIKFIASNSLWMGFVPLGLFPHDTNWEEIIDERIDVSLRTSDDQLKVIKCGILPLQQQRPHTFKRFVRSCSLSFEDLSSLFHELVYQEVDYRFSSNSDNKEREQNRQSSGDARRCGKTLPIGYSFASSEAWYLYTQWSNGFKREKSRASSYGRRGNKIS